jgi:hypothetical protein
MSYAARPLKFSTIKQFVDAFFPFSPSLFDLNQTARAMHGRPEKLEIWGI